MNEIWQQDAFANMHNFNHIRDYISVPDEMIS